MSAVRPGLPDPLVDLLGARWAMGVAVTGAAWFGTAGVAAFGLADGTLAVARASWDGMASLRPRDGGGVELVPATAEPPPVMRAGVHAGACLAVAAAGDTVISGGVDGRLARVCADGEVATLASFPEVAVACVAAVDGVWACAAGRQVHRFGPAPATLDLAGPVAALAFDGAGRRLAIAGADGVTLWPSDAAATLLPRAGLHRALAWSADGAILVSGQEQRSVGGWRLPEAVGIAMGDCPGQPLSLSFSIPGGFCAASGSPRVACWHFDGPGGAAQRSECGLGSAIAVTQVACHPRRPLIAAGYENGAVLLCQPGSADILFVRAAGGGAVGTLAWSPDGAFLAFGAAAGEIGVVAFPERLFRPLPHSSEPHVPEQRDSKP